MAEPGPSDQVSLDYQTAQRLIAAMRVVEQLSGRLTGKGSGGRGPQYSPPVTLRIRNDSGEDRKKFEVLCINEIVGSEIQNTAEQARIILLSGINPNTGVSRHRPCVLLQDCPAGGDRYADFVMSGLCIAKVDILDTGHNCVELVNGDPTKLQSAKDGPGQIIFAGSGTGEKLALICLGAGGGGGSTLTFGYGKTDSASSLDATVTVSVWTAMGSAGSDTGDNITCYNRFGAIGSGKFVAWMFDGTGYDIIQGRC